MNAYLLLLIDTREPSLKDCESASENWRHLSVGIFPDSFGDVRDNRCRLPPYVRTVILTSTSGSSFKSCREELINTVNEYHEFSWLRLLMRQEDMYS